jgi:hypothetical protein
MSLIERLWVWLRCKCAMCPCVPMDDDTGCWGQCVTCGKRFGFVTREQLRRYADHELKARGAK